MNSSSVFIQEKKVFDSLDKIRLFYPDNNDQNLEAYKLTEDKLKKDIIMIPPPRSGAKEVSLFHILVLNPIN